MRTHTQFYVVILIQYLLSSAVKTKQEKSIDPCN